MAKQPVQNLKIRLELYRQFLEEARYRDRLIVEECSIGIVGFGVLLGVAYQLKENWPINVLILIIGLFVIFLLTYSTSMLSAHRAACWTAAKKIEKSLKGMIGDDFVRQRLDKTWRKGSTVRRRYEKRYPFLRLPKGLDLSFTYFMWSMLLVWLGMNLYWIIC